MWGQVRSMVATSVTQNAIWPNASAVPRLAAPASSATAVAPANAPASTRS